MKLTNCKMKIYATFLTLACLCLAATAQTVANYEAVVEGQNPSCYFTFDGGSLTSVAGSNITLTASPAGGQFIYDIFENPTNCVFFSLQGDYVTDPNESTTDQLISTNLTSSGAITLLFRTPDPGPPSGATTSPGAKTVFSAEGNTTNGNAFYLWFENPNGTNHPGALDLYFGTNVTTLLPCTNVIPDAWYYFAISYNENTTNSSGQPNTNKATWYLGQLNDAGALVSGTTVNSTNDVAGDGADFFIGARSNAKSELNKPGDGRVGQFAIWNHQLSAAQIQAQFTNLPNLALPPVSQYQTVISNQSPAHYFQLAGNTADSMDTSFLLLTNSTQDTLVTNPATGGFMYSCGYCPDYFLDPTGACYFAFGADTVYTNGNLLNGGGTFVNGVNGTGKGSISGMFHGLTDTNFYAGQKFIFSAGDTPTNGNAFALFLEQPTAANNPWALKCYFGNSSAVMLTNPLSAWYYFAITYDETATNKQATWYVGQPPGGTLLSGVFSATNGSLAGDGGHFYIGNNIEDADGFRYQNSSHTGNGQVSQIAIWDGILATNEVQAQFNALSVSPPAPPTLSIILSEANVILSWPTAAGSGFTLQSATNLVLPSWSGAGTSFVVGTNNVVTNGISTSAHFYRLIN
jgi:hypothetical protein